MSKTWTSTTVLRARGLAATLLVLGLVLGLASCATQRGQPPVTLDRTASWTVLPFRNLSQTPMSAERVESLVLSALRANSLPKVDLLATDPAAADALPLLDDGQRFAEALSKARSGGYQYGVTGSVEEWRYKSGLDGEPAVGLSIRVVDVATGNTLWSNSAARSGWSRESLTGNGQKVINRLLAQMFDKSSWFRRNGSL